MKKAILIKVSTPGTIPNDEIKNPTKGIIKPSHLLLFFERITSAKNDARIRIIIITN